MDFDRTSILGGYRGIGGLAWFVLAEDALQVDAVFPGVGWLDVSGIP